MPDSAVGAAEVVRIVTRDSAFLDEQLPHWHHFPFNFLTLRAEIIKFAGRWIGIDFRYLENAAVPPSHGQVLVVGLPVVFECSDDPRGPAIETSRDVLLPVGNEIPFRSLGVYGHVDTEAKAC